MIIQFKQFHDSLNNVVILAPGNFPMLNVLHFLQHLRNETK